MKIKILILLIIIPLVALFVISKVSPQVSANEEQHKNGQLIADNNIIYLIENNQRRAFHNILEMYTHGYRKDMILKASRLDMALSQGSDMTIRNHSFILDTSDGHTLYLFYNGKARPITDPFTSQFLSVDQRIYLKMNLNEYPKDSPIDGTYAYGAKPLGTLIKHNGTLYLITENGRAGFPSVPVFLSYGYSIDSAVEASDFDMRLPEAPVLRYRDGTMVSDNGTVYLIFAGKKYGFSSWSSFANRGYLQSAIIFGNTQGYEEKEKFQ